MNLAVRKMIMAEGRGEDMTKELFILTQDGYLIRFNAIVDFYAVSYKGRSGLHYSTVKGPDAMLGCWENKEAAKNVMMGIAEWVKAVDNTPDATYRAVFNIPKKDEAGFNSESMRYWSTSV